MVPSRLLSNRYERRSEIHGRGRACHRRHCVSVCSCRLLRHPILSRGYRLRFSMAGASSVGITAARGHPDRLVYRGIGRQCRHSLARPATLPAGVNMRSSDISLDRHRSCRCRAHPACSVENLCLSCKAPLLVRSVAVSRPRRCPPMPASSSMTASIARQCYGPSRAIAACFALTPMFRAHPFKRPETVAAPKDAARRVNVRNGSKADTSDRAKDTALPAG